MPTKLGFIAILLMVLICFVPVTLLWLLAVVMLTASYMASFAGDASSIMFVISSIILLFMGGVGLIGVIRMMDHIYRQGYQPADIATIRCLYAGMLSLALLNISMIISMGFSPVVIVFVIPIICSLALIKLTSKKQTSEKISLFDDQVI